MSIYLRTFVLFFVCLTELSYLIKNLNITLNNNIFKKNLSDAKNNWLNISVEDVIDNVISYFNSLEIVQT